jgi:hypothetical protein
VPSPIRRNSQVASIPQGAKNGWLRDSARTHGPTPRRRNSQVASNPQSAKNEGDRVRSEQLPE